MTDTIPTTTSADRLDAAVTDLHVPDAAADGEALLVKLGVVLPVIGLVLVGVAWWNASGTAFVADQIPMLISGALGGLALVVIGIGLYIRFTMARAFRFWSARLVVEQQAQTDRVVEALASLEAAVRDGKGGPRSQG